MTLKKSTITIIAQIIILFSLFLVSIIIDKAIIFVLGIVIMIICSTILTFIESRKVLKIIHKNFLSGEYQNIINFLNTKIDKNYFKYTNNICLIHNSSKAAGTAGFAERRKARSDSSHEHDVTVYEGNTATSYTGICPHQRD